MNDMPSDYTVSIHYDRRLYRQDIAGSMAHVRMLARQGIISDGDANTNARPDLHASAHADAHTGAHRYQYARTGHSNP